MIQTPEAAEDTPPAAQRHVVKRGPWLVVRMTPAQHQAQAQQIRWLELAVELQARRYEPRDIDIATLEPRRAG